MVFEDFVGFFLNYVGFVCWVCKDLASRPLVSELTLALAGALFCEVDLTDPRHEFCLPLLWVLSFGCGRCL